MAWDDAPPTQEELSPSTGGWDSKPPTEDELQPIGKMESVARGAANNFPLLPQAIAAGESFTGIGDEGGYSKNLADWNAKAAAAKQANPKSYGAGAVAGSFAPAFIPGVGEALEAAPILGNAALGAANAISNTDLTKDPSEILKQAGEGAAIGGAVGGVSEGIGNALSSLKPAASRIESNATAGALDLNSHAIRNLAKRMGDTPEGALSTVNDKVQELFPDLVGATDTAGSKLQKLSQAHDVASSVIGQVIDATSQKEGGVIPEVSDAIKSLEQEAGKFEGYTSARNLEAQKELQDAALTLKNLQEGGQLNFKNLYEVKKGIGSAYHNPNLNNPGVDKAYGILADTIDSILERTTVDNPSYKEGFDHAKDIFKFTSDLIPAMTPGAAREAAGVGGGLLNAGLGAAAVMGHPIPAIAGYAGKTALKLGAPDLAQNLAYKGVNAIKPLVASAPVQGLIRGLPGIQRGMANSVGDYLESKYGKKEIQK